MVGRDIAADRGATRLAHPGVYFETRALTHALPFVTPATFSQTPNVIIDASVSCDGQFHRIDRTKLLSASPSAVSLDMTLLGRDDGVDEYLAAMAPGGKQVMMRLASCLKLPRGGFEPANRRAVGLHLLARRHRRARRKYPTHANACW